MNASREPATERALRGAGMVSLLGGMWLLLWYWPGGLPYDSTSGVWSALAHDFSHGILYRPLQGELGYGGTRYGPLFFVLHGLLLKTGLGIGAAGLLLTLTSLGLLGAVAWGLMRAVGADRGLAISCVMLMPASVALQLLGLAVKGDLWAAAASTAGLWASFRWQRRQWRPGLVLAWLLFSAAVLTKFTAVFGLGAMLVWLVRERRIAAAAQLAAGTLAVSAFGFAAAYEFSAGRIADSFAACASGGLQAAYAWKFAGWFALVAAQDPFFSVLFIVAGWLAVRRIRRQGIDLVITFFLTTTLGTMLLFVSPGIDSNHLVDLLVASVGLIALEVTEGGAARGLAWGAWAFAALVVFTWLPGAPSVRHFLTERGRPSLAGVREIARRLPPAGTARILAENPLVPLVLDRPAEVLDPFSLRLLAEREPSVRDRFMGDLAAGRYSAVVLVDWSGVPLEELPAAMARHSSPGARRFYGEMNFPPRFLDTLQARYRLSFRVPPFVVFEPKEAPPR